MSHDSENFIFVSFQIEWNTIKFINFDLDYEPDWIPFSSLSKTKLTSYSSDFDITFPFNKKSEKRGSKKGKKRGKKGDKNRLAQAIEHETVNFRVVGSSPRLGAKYRGKYRDIQNLICWNEGRVDNWVFFVYSVILYKIMINIYSEKYNYNT